MNTVIRDDFANFINNEELFNSDVKLYDSQGGTLKFEGKGIYNEKPKAVINEDGSVSYEGELSVLTISKSELDFMPSYFSLKAYYVEITDNNGTHTYWVGYSSFSSNVGSIFCYLKEKIVEI